MHTEQPSVSIIVRIKHSPKLLQRALKSIAAQTFRKIEVVLVDDGSFMLAEDEMQGILGHIPLSRVRCEKDAGNTHSGNTGIRRARGKYIGFLDDKDALYPEHIEVLSNLLAGSDYKVVYANCEAVSLSCGPGTDAFDEISEGSQGMWEPSSDVRLFEDAVPLSSILFDNDILRSSGGFDESLGMFEDWDLIIRIFSLTPFYHVAAVTSRYTREIRDCGLPATDPDQLRSAYIRVLEKHTEKITPHTIYSYLTCKEEFRREQERLIRSLEDELLRQKKYLGHAGSAQADSGHPGDHMSAVGHLTDIRKQLDEKNSYIEEIHRSLGWKMLMFYRQKIKTFMAPEGTKRQKFYRLALASMPLLKEKGAPFVFRKAKNVLRRLRAEKNIEKEQYHIPAIHDEIPGTADVRVSVVIPTRNAGSDFRYTLEKISGQKGIREIELIIVDSGSEDGTPALAEKYGARVFSVNPFDFNHGATRNFGAEKASGDFLVFMSQDAIPIGDLCLFNLISKMHQDMGIAAATLKQVPRSDADLFSCWQLWFYNNKLLRYSEDFVAALNTVFPEGVSPEEKRRLMQIDNVFSCFRREVFNRFRFREIAYAEDLDLGRRLIEGGHKILFMISSGVIHSHNRPAEYFFRRGYIDTRTLLQLLRHAPINWEHAGITSVEQMLAYLYSLYKRVNYSMEEFAFSSGDGYPLDQLIPAIKSQIQDTRNPLVLRGEPGIDRLFTRFFSGSFHQNGKSMPAGDDVLMHQYFMFLDSFSEYLTGSNMRVVPGNMKKELIEALYKLFAWTSGANIGNFIAFSDSRGESYRNSYVETILGN